MLLTSGCSFVWGDELEGYDKNPPTHWELTWTHLLSKELGMEYVNLASCGASNDKIFRDVISYLHNPDNEKPTHIAILWSAWQRQEVVEHMNYNRESSMGLNRNQDITQFSPMRTQLIGDRNKRNAYDILYNDAYDSRTDIIHGLTRMQTMEILCDSLGIKLVQGVFHHSCWVNILATLKDIGTKHDSEPYRNKEVAPTESYKEWVMDTVGSLKPTSRIGMGRSPTLSDIMSKIDDVKPHSHPGERSQVIFTEMMLNTFKSIE